MGKRDNSGHEKKRFRTPPVEIYETPKSVTLRAEMPGVEKQDFDIGLDGDELTISAKRRSTNSGLRRIHGESNQADYLRVFSIGDELDASNVEATVEKGILTLTIPKKPEVLPRKIQVEVE